MSLHLNAQIPLRMSAIKFANLRLRVENSVELYLASQTGKGAAAAQRSLYTESAWALSANSRDEGERDFSHGIAS